MKQYAALDDTVYLWFAANDTSGSGGDGASPTADVRLAGAAAGAAPVYSPTPVLLTHANYPPGAHEIAIAATAGNGFATGNTYAVFCTLAIDSQNPTGFVGSFDLKPVESNLIQIGDAAQSATDLKDFADAGYDPATNKIEACKVNDDMRGTDSANTTVPDAAGVAPTAAEIKTEVEQAGSSLAQILVDTGELQTDWANGGRLDLLLDAIPTTAMRGTDSAALASTCTEARLAELAAANLPTDIDTILTRLSAARAGYLDNLSAGAVALASALTTHDGKLDTVDGIVDAILLDTGTDGVVVASGSKTGYALSAAGVDAIIDEVIEGTLTLRQMLRIIKAATAGKSAGGGTATLTFRDVADSKNRITATVDADGNRTAMTVDGA